MVHQEALKTMGSNGMFVGIWLPFWIYLNFVKGSQGNAVKIPCLGKTESMKWCANVAQNIFVLVLRMES